MTLEPTPSAIPVWWYSTSWTWKPLKPPKLLLYFLIIRNPRNWGPHLHTRHRDCKRVPWIEHCWWWLGWGKNHFFYLGYYDWPAWKRITLTQNFYPLAPMSDQDIISPYHVNTLSTIQMMRIQRNINFGIFSWSNTKFSELTIQQLYDRQLRELLIWSGSERVKRKQSLWLAEITETRLSVFT